MTRILPTLDLLKRHMEYLSIAQSVVAQNIANAATPKYKAQAVLSFSEVLRRRELDNTRSIPLARTSAHHMKGEYDATASFIYVPSNKEASLDGNTVDLREEMENSSAYLDAHKQSQGIYSRMMSVLRSIVSGN